MLLVGRAGRGGVKGSAGMGSARVFGVRIPNTHLVTGIPGGREHEMECCGQGWSGG